MASISIIFYYSTSILISLITLMFTCQPNTPSNHNHKIKFKFNVINSNLVNDEDTCTICLSELNDLELNDNIYQTKCNHYYHKNCITEWIQSDNELSFKCPLCLRSMNS